MNFRKLFLTTILSAVVFTSCTDDDDNDLPLGAYDNGVLILNQGGFGNGNASVSFLSNDLNTFQNNIFALVNPTVTLGDTAQDIGFINDLAYIVLNVSNKIEIVNRYTLQRVATISTGLSNPRYIVFKDGKGYVSNWGNGTSTTDDYVAVINLSNNTLSSPIPVVEGPERMVVNGAKLYVAHQGGFGFGSTVSVIDLSSSAVASINVGDVPNSLQVVDGSLYVLSGGKPSWSGTETAGRLSKINLTNNTITSALNFAVTSHPSNLAINDSQAYYTVGSNIFKSALASTSLPTAPLFSTTPQGVYGVYSFAVNDNKIYVGDALNFSSNGKVYVYSTAGSLLLEKTVGIIPAGFYFN